MKSLRSLILLSLLSILPSVIHAQGLLFYPLTTPCRLTDTRNDGGAVAGGTSLTVAAQGVCGIPATAKAIVGNITTVLPVARGWAVVYSGDIPLPLIASTNYLAGSVTNNAFTTSLGATGNFKVFTLVTTDMVLDVVGYYALP